jgi:hypothetical protein
MLGWFKKKPSNDAQTGQQQEFQRHALQAEGPPFVRSLIASAMCAVEEDTVTQERNKLPAGERLGFMLTYECFVVYALKIGVERVGKPGSFEKARMAIENHYLKYAYFDPNLYQSIWRDLVEFMTAPLDMPTGTPDTPIGKLLLAALQNRNLFPTGKEPIMGLKSHLGFELQVIADFAEKTTEYMLQMANQ